MANEDRAQTSMPNLISLVEAADQFGVSVKTLRRHHTRIPRGTSHPR